MKSKFENRTSNKYREILYFLISLFSRIFQLDDSKVNSEEEQNDDSDYSSKKRKRGKYLIKDYRVVICSLKRKKYHSKSTIFKLLLQARNERRRKAKSPTRRRKSAKMIVTQMRSLKLNQSWSQLQQKARKVKVVNLSKMNKQTRICQQQLNCAKIIV